ncbi:Putative Mitochondrial distribution and morphology protein 34 [Rhizopus microsporus]|nr:Putative Mitochondrial distribution and morphology protein 34 [Rhizopus microsporus]
MKFNLTTPHPFSCHYSDTQSDILSSATTLVDIYADDADAPWYAKEALISPIYNNNDKASPVVFDDLILRPNENQMVSKLFKLASVHYTLSPLTEVIPHFTYRSLPYTIKSYSHAKTNKVPKRRIIKLSLSAPLI